MYMESLNQYCGTCTFNLCAGKGKMAPNQVYGQQQYKGHQPGKLGPTHVRCVGPVL